MAEFINFEAEEDGEGEIENNNSCDGSESDVDDDDCDDFIDNKIIHEDIPPPNPYLNDDRLVLPRGLEEVVNRVSCLYIFIFVYFQKKNTEWGVDENENACDKKRKRSPSPPRSDEDLPVIKRRRVVRVSGQKRKRSPSPSPARPRSPNLGFPPTPPRTPSPIMISSESEVEISDSSTDSSTETEPDEPKRKKFRICTEENVTKEYQRNEEEYLVMHEKVMKPMKRTQANVKLKYKEFFPAKKAKFDIKLRDHKTYGRGSREYALKRMREIMNTHLRVKKLKEGKEDPLTEDEMALTDITIDTIPHEPIGYDRVGEDYTQEQEKILQELRFSEYLIYSTSLRKYLKLGLSDCCVKRPVEALDKDDYDLRKCMCCDVNIFIAEWPEHIKSYYHQIMLKYRWKKFEYCWLNRKEVLPHRVEQCDVCQKRRQEIKDGKSEAFLDDMALYDPANDPEYQAYLERSKALSSPGMSDRYSCVPCGKVNLSLEYYNNHIQGKGHKMKMGQLNKPGVKKAEGVKRGMSHSKTDRFGKRIVKGSEEEAKAESFANFFQFLKRNSTVHEESDDSDSSPSSPDPTTVSEPPQEEKKKNPNKKKKQW